jgi:serine protease
MKWNIHRTPTMKATTRLLVLTSFLVIGAIAQTASAQSGPYQYYPLSPCRVVDTRGATSTNGGPIFGSNATRNFQIRGLCGVPTTAKAVSLNVTITGATQSSYLSVWPSGQARPVVSMLNFEAADPALANGILVGLSTAAQDLSVYNNFGSVHVIIDVTGYFQ